VVREDKTNLVPSQLSECAVFKLGGFFTADSDSQREHGLIPRQVKATAASRR
jgi:hypothetical protein